MPGGGQHLVPPLAQPGHRHLGHLQGGGDLQLPGRDRQPAAAARSAATSRPVRSAPSPSAGAPWWNSTAPLRPGGVPGPQIAIGLQQRPALQDVAGRDPALRQPALGQQHPQMPAVGLAGLGVPLAAAGERGIGRLGQVRRNTGRGQLLGDMPPPGAPLDRGRDILTAGEPRQPGPQVHPVRRGDLAAAHLPGAGVEVAKGAGGTLFLETDDCQASYEELSARGVTFNDPPTAQPYDIDTSFRDPSGNNIRLTQVLDFDPARGTAPPAHGQAVPWPRSPAFTKHAEATPGHAADRVERQQLRHEKARRTP